MGRNAKEIVKITVYWFILVKERGIRFDVGKSISDRRTSCRCFFDGNPGDARRRAGYFTLCASAGFAFDPELLFRKMKILFCLLLWGQSLQVFMHNGASAKSKEQKRTENR